MKINKEGESCPTSVKDSRRALDANADVRKKIKSEIKRQDDQVLQIRSQD